MVDTFSLNLDLTEVMQAHKNLASEIQARLEVAAKNLAAQTHAHIKEQAAAKLHVRLPEFLKGLDFEQVDDNTWAITIKAEARWIEDGQEPRSLLDSLLASPKAKQGKNGKYIVVPFKHDKGPSKQTPHQRAITADLKSQLRGLKIPYKRVEKNTDGSPKLGLLHSLNFKPKSKSQFPMVGSASGTPFLQGVRIYQSKNAKGKTERSIFTFRTASENGKAKWMHPGNPPMHFMEEAYQWCTRLWETEIAPQVITGLGGGQS